MNDQATTEHQETPQTARPLLSGELAAEKQQETAWNNFWRDREQKERELFERSYRSHKLNRHHGTGEYEYRYVENCWHGWMDRAFLIYTEAANAQDQADGASAPVAPGSQS